MKYRSSNMLGALAVVFIALPCLGFPQEPPAPKEQPKQDPPTPRLDLYGDPLPEGAIARMGTVRLRSPDPVSCLAVSPDGKLLAGGSPEAVHIWEVATGAEVTVLEGHRFMVSAVAFSADGKWVTVLDGQAGPPSTLRVRALKTGEDIWKRDLGTGSHPALAVSPDGARIAITRRIKASDFILLIDARTGEVIGRAGERGQFRCTKLTWSPKGDRLIGGNYAGAVRVWDVSGKGKPRKIGGSDVARADVEGGERHVHGIAVSPDGKTVAIAGVGLSVVLWRLDSGGGTRQLASHDGPVKLVAFSPDGRLIASAGKDTIRVTEIDPGEEILLLKSLEALALAFTSGGGALIIATREAVIVLDPRTGKRILLEDAPEDRIDLIEYSSDGTMLLGGSTTGGGLHLWRADTGRRSLALRAFDPLRLTGIRLSPEGEHIAARGYANLRVWKTATGKTVLRHASEVGPFDPGGLEQAIGALEFSADGGLIATGTGGGKVQLWDVGRGQPLWEFSAHEGAVILLRFAKDGKTLRSWGADGRAIRLSLTDGVMKSADEPLSEGALMSAVLSPNDGRIAYGYRSGAIRVADARGALALHIPRAHRDGVESLAFSPEGRWLLSRGALPKARIGTPGGPSSFDDVRHYRLWDLGSGAEVLTLRADPGWYRSYKVLDEKGNKVWKRSPDSEGLVQDAAFLRGGRLLAVGGRDERLYIREISTGLPVLILDGHRNEIEDLATSPDGGRLATASVDATVLVWDMVSWRRPADGALDLSDADVRDRAWAVLAGGDAAAAQQAIARLAAAGQEAVAFLKSRLETVPAAEPQRMSDLIVQLDHDEFTVREDAARELKTLGDKAAPALRRALAQDPSPEVRERLAPLVEALGPPISSFPSERLRGVRAVQVLEEVGIPSALEILETLAKGHPHALQTREAKAALERLEARGAK